MEDQPTKRIKRGDFKALRGLDFKVKFDTVLKWKQDAYKDQLRSYVQEHLIPDVAELVLEYAAPRHYSMRLFWSERGRMDTGVIDTESFHTMFSAHGWFRVSYTYLTKSAWSCCPDPFIARKQVDPYSNIFLETEDMCLPGHILSLTASETERTFGQIDGKIYKWK